MALHSWVSDADAALFTDLYQLTMMQAYFREELREEAVFDLFVRRLPPERNYVVACGLDDALHYLETLRFTPEALRYLEGLKSFRPDFLDFLAGLRFTGDVYALPEGTPVFPDEPILQLLAPMPEAQLVESFLLNQITFQSMAASKASRVVTAAAGRRVVDFGMRRVHGTDAGMKAARAFYIAGVHATSNVLAGRVYGIPVSGTMAHAYIEAHDHETEAFRAFAELYPGTTLLVDTYDTLEGVRRAVRLAREHGDGFRIGAIRLDSGDLGRLARQSREILDEAGLDDVEIVASGSLDEGQVADLVAEGAPIDAFGVGTRMGTSADYPYLDTAYKLVEYGGEGRMKLSASKANLPGRKQIFRFEEQGTMARDVIALAHEEAGGEPLLVPVMRGGKRLPAGRFSLESAREHANATRARLPAHLRALEPSSRRYPVEISPALRQYRDEVRARLAKTDGA